jgi:hypothetical protein
MNLHKDISGKRCAHDECRQIDWMPIECKYCHKDIVCWIKQFCLEHSSVDRHRCQEVYKDLKKVFICSVCKKSVLIDPTKSADDNVLWLMKIRLLFMKPQSVQAYNKNNRRYYAINVHIKSLCSMHIYAQDAICPSVESNTNNVYLGIDSRKIIPVYKPSLAIGQTHDSQSYWMLGFHNHFSNEVILLSRYYIIYYPVYYGFSNMILKVCC